MAVKSPCQLGPQGPEKQPTKLTMVVDFMWAHNEHALQENL